MEQIIIKIKGGKMSIEVNGVKGVACTDLTKSLEKAVGSVIQNTATNEMYEAANQEYVSQTN